MIKQRWKLTDHPNSVTFKAVRDQIHPEVTEFNQMDQHTQKRFKDVKLLVSTIYPGAKCYAFGSRINGRWREDSDYDVAVTGVKMDKLRDIKTYAFGFPVDIKFCNEPVKAIEIP